MALLQILIGLLCLGAAFLLALLFAFVFAWSAGGLSMARHSRRWPTAKGTITFSEVRSNRLANGLPGQRYVVRYRYSVGAKSYSSDTVTGGWFPYGTTGWAGRRVALYPDGSEVDVFFDPEDPESSVLEAGINWECLYPVFIVALVAGLSLGFSVLGIRMLWLAVVSFLP